MTISVVRLGSARGKVEGPRLGTVRRPPRGVKKRDYARLDYYDVWLPELAPSARLIKTALKDWKRFAKRLLEVLARLSRDSNFAVGCYCEDEKRCHRSILRQLFVEHGARIAV